MNDQNLSTKLKDLQFALLETNAAVGAIRQNLNESGTPADIQPALENVACALGEIASGLRPLLAPNSEIRADFDTDASGVPVYRLTRICAWLRSYIGRHDDLGPQGVELAEALSGFVDKVDVAVAQGAVKP
jgi:hypothetical protein